MASHKFSIDFEEINSMLDDLKKVDGNVEEATEEALSKSHEYITPLIEKKLDKSNLPAHGKYSTKDRKHSIKQIIREPNIQWTGKTCTVDVGFNLDNSPVPIFLIRGGKGGAVKGLKTLLEGNKTKEKVAEIQQGVIFEAISKAMRGD